MASGGANLTVGVNNTSFSKQMKEMVQELKEVGSQFNLVSATAKASGSIFGQAGITIDRLKAQMEVYNKQLELEKTRMTELTSVQEKLKQKHAELDVAVLKAREDLAKEEIESGKSSEASKILAEELAKLEKQYISNTNAIKNNANNLTDVRTKMNNTQTDIVKTNAEMKKFADVNLDRVGQGFKSIGGYITDLSKDMQKISALIVGFGAISLKANIDTEDSFAGVRKTVNMTKEELDKLEEDTFKMTESMPSNFGDFATVEQNAGQLGIANKNIESFTKTMVEMKDATDLTADDASTKLAKLVNITGMAQSQFNNLGSSIVALGNSVGAKESDIVEFSTRIAGAGTNAHMTTAEIVGLGAGLSSLGLEPEAGASAISKTINAMTLATAKGGPQLTNFAKVSGITAKEFQDSWKKDPTETLLKFIAGLKNAQTHGINTMKVLSDMGITETRELDTLLRLTNSNDKLGQAVGISTKAFKDNNALQKEVENRYSTNASQIKMLNNQFTELKVSVGELLLPVLKELINDAKNLINWWKGLTDENKNQIIWYAKVFIGLTLVTTVVGQLCSGIGTLIGLYVQIKWAEMFAGMSMASLAGKGLTGVLSGITSGVLGVGRAIVLFLATNPVGWIIDAIALLGVLLYKYCEPFKNWIQSIGRYFGLFQDSAKDATSTVSDNVDDMQNKVQETLDKSGDIGKNAGQDLTNNYADAVQTGATDVVDNTKDMEEKVQKSLDDHKKNYDDFCNGVKDALKNMYEDEEKQQEDSLNKQIKAEEDASKQRLKILEDEHKKKTDWIDEESKKAEKAYQDQIDALDVQQKNNDRAKEELEYNQKIAEDKQKIANATSDSARQDAKNDLIKDKNDRQTQVNKENIDDQKEALEKKKTDTKDYWDEQKKQEDTAYNNSKQKEDDFLQTFKDNKQIELDETKSKYQDLLKEDNLFAESRKIILNGNQEELLNLLQSYNPKWQNAGQSLADSLINGLNSEKQSMADAINKGLSLDKVIEDEEKSLEYYKEIQKNKDSGTLDYNLPGPADASTDLNVLSDSNTTEEMTYKTQEPEIDKAIAEKENTQDSSGNSWLAKLSSYAEYINPLTAPLKTIKDLINGDTQSFVEGLPFVKKYLDSIKENSAEASNTAQSSFNNMQTNLNTNISRMDATANSKMNSINNSATTNFNGMQNTLNTNLTNMDNTNTQKMSNIDNTANLTFSEMLSSFVNGFLGLNNQTSTGLDSINTTTSTWQGGFLNIFQVLFQSYLPGAWTLLFNQQDSLTNQTQNFASNTVYNPFFNLINELKDIGKQVWAGFVDGLTNNPFSKEVKGLTDKVINAFKDPNTGFDIHSPSRKMKKEIGKMVIPGVLAGIEEDMPLLNNAVQKLSNFSVSKSKESLNFQKNNGNTQGYKDNKDIYAYITIPPITLDGKQIANAVTSKVKVTLSRELKQTKLITT